MPAAGTFKPSEVQVERKVKTSQKRQTALVCARFALPAVASGQVSGLIYINMPDSHLRDHGGQQDSGWIGLMGPAKAAILAGVKPVPYCLEDAQ
jgi:hypothetical protein